MSSKFKYTKDIHQVNTRSSADHQLAVCKSSNPRSFQYQGAIEWNKLPLQIRATNNLKSFKEAILCQINDQSV